MLISAYTGLRISDVATFHIDRMMPDGDIHFRAIKNGKWVDTWVPEFIQEIIRKRAEKWGPYIFGARKTEDPVVLGGTWRERLEKLWALCEPFTEKPTHHRFRHTFVRILLEDGTPVPDVATLLGDTEEVVRQSYSKWVPERQERLRRVLRVSFGKKTRLFAVK
jgi:integrase